MTKDRTKPKPKRRRTDAELREALSVAGGNITHAARILDIASRTIRRRLNASPALAEFVDDCRQDLIDRAEFGIARAVDAGDVSACKFVLSTLGRDRGYATRSEVKADITANEPTVLIYLPDNGRAPSQATGP